jgi:hypothetical protein
MVITTTLGGVGHTLPDMHLTNNTYFESIFFI